MIVKHLKSETIKESMGWGVEEDKEKVKERERYEKMREREVERKKNTVEMVD